jgi:hypothetical protein
MQGPSDSSEILASTVTIPFQVEDLFIPVHRRERNNSGTCEAIQELENAYHRLLTVYHEKRSTTKRSMPPHDDSDTEDDGTDYFS